MLRWDALDGTLIGLCDVDVHAGTATITLASGLDRAERNAVLAHELVHLERGGGVDYAGSPPSWQAVVAREERIVDREVARRLVPPRELHRLARARRSTGDPVTIDDVIEEFDVPEWVARDAVDLSRRRATPPRA